MVIFWLVLGLCVFACAVCGKLGREGREGRKGRGDGEGEPPKTT